MARTFRRKRASSVHKYYATTHWPFGSHMRSIANRCPGMRVPIPGMEVQYHLDGYHPYKPWDKGEYGYRVHRRHRRVMQNELHQYMKDEDFEVQAHRASIRRHNRVSLTRFQSNHEQY